MLGYVDFFLRKNIYRIFVAQKYLFLTRYSDFDYKIASRKNYITYRMVCYHIIFMIIIYNRNFIYNKKHILTKFT